MANTGVIIKRSFQTAIPAELEPGELAYSYVSNVIFVGSATGDGVLNIGGYYYTETLDAATPDNVANTLVRRDANGNFQGVLVGNANTADRFSNTRYFAVSGGDITASSVAFDGSNNVTLNASLNTIDGLTPGYYGGLASVPVIQVAANGRIISVANSTSTSSFTIEGNTGSSLFAGGNLRFEGGTPGIRTVETSNGTNTTVTFLLDNAVITPANLVNGGYTVNLDDTGKLNVPSDIYLGVDGGAKLSTSYFGGGIVLTANASAGQNYTLLNLSNEHNYNLADIYLNYEGSNTAAAYIDVTDGTTQRTFAFRTDGSLNTPGNITTPGIVTTDEVVTNKISLKTGSTIYSGNNGTTDPTNYVVLSANIHNDVNGFQVTEGQSSQATIYTEGDINFYANTSGAAVQWTFGKDKKTTFPDGATLSDAYQNDGTSLRASPTKNYIRLASSDLHQYVQTNSSGVYVATNAGPGVPTGVANWNGQGGWNQNYYTDLPTTGGTGTGLTVDVAAGGGGYINIEAITIHNPGTGYTDGDVITISNEYDLTGTFTVVVPSNIWSFNADGTLTLPKLSGQIGRSGYTDGIDLYNDNGGSGYVRMNYADQSFVWVDPSGAHVQTYGAGSNHTWGFGTNGGLTLPGDTTIDDTSDYGNAAITAPSGKQLKLYSGDQSSLITVDPTALYFGVYRNTAPKYWSFDADGYINFPDNTAQLTAFTGTAIDQYARDAANNSSSGSAIDQFVRSVANTAAANTVYLRGVDLAQNASITILQNVNTTQNAAITTIQGVDLTQNTRITSADDLARSAFGWANVAYTQANVGATFVNTGGTVSGNVSITKNLTVTGNLNVLGNTTSISVNELVLDDTLIYLGANNYSSDVVDIGIIGHYNDGANAHTGIFRDPNLKEWIFFKGYTPEIGANNLIDINHASFKYANVYASYVKGNLIGTNVVVNGLDLYNYVTNAYGKANTVGTLAQAGFDAANTAAANTVYLQGVDATQNTNITAVNTYATGAYGKANSANVLAQAAFDKANSAAASSFDQYARDTANTAASNTVSLQSVNTLQNTNITAVNTYATSGYGQANVATTLAQASFDKANTTSANTVYTQGVDATQNTNITAVNTYATSAYGQANAANVLAQASFNVANTASSNTVYTQGVDATQNTNITAVNTYATSAYGKANSANVLAQAAFDSANTAAANTVYLQGVDATQNTNITAVNTYATSAYGKANSANVLAQAAFDVANTATANTVYTQGVDATQNTNILAVNTFAGSAYSKANSANVLAQASFDVANTLAANVVYILGVDATQNSRLSSINTYAYAAYSQANVATTLAQAAFDRANTDNTLGQAAFDAANTKLNISGGTVTGNITFNGANVALGNVSNVHLYGGNTGQLLTTDGAGNITFIDLPTPNTVSYTANSLIQTNGVYVSGNLWSTQIFGDYGSANGAYVLTDGSGSAPAWYIDFDFINVVKFNRVVLNINYTQSSGHTIYIQLYNNTTSAWDSIGTYTGLGSYYAFALEVIDEAAYVSSGRVQLRIYHSNQGNTAHQTSIDYVALEQSFQGPQGPRGPTGATGATGATGNGVSSGGTTGQVLIKGSSANYDTVWSNNLIDSYNTANAAFIAANASSVLAQAGFNTANSSSANTVYTQGVDATQNTNITSINTFAGSAYDKANVGATLAQIAFDSANTNASYSQGVNDTQNTNILAVNTFAGSAYDKANNASANTIVTQGVDAGQNAAITIIQGVDVTQNNLITAIQGVDLAQNSAITILQGVDAGQNTELSIIQGVDLGQNTAISIIQGVDAGQNAAITIIQGVDTTQNTRITSADDLARSAFTQANVGTTFINTGGTISGNVSITQDLTVTGNLNILGNSTVIHTSQIDVYDSLIYLANNNFTSDAVDIGIIGHYKGPSVGEHAGIFRDPNLKEWIFFKGYTPEVQSNNLIDINDASFQQANVYAAYVKGNLIGTNVVVNGLDLYNYVTNAYGKANTVGTLAQASFDYANTAASNTVYTQGVDLTQNTNITAVNTYATSAYGKANSANVLAQAAFDSANTRVLKTGDTITGTLNVNANIVSTKANTGSLIVNGGVGVSDSIYVGNKVGFSNTSNVSMVYQFYNSSTNSLDTVFG